MTEREWSSQSRVKRKERIKEIADLARQDIRARTVTENERPDQEEA